MTVFRLSSVTKLLKWNNDLRDYAGSYGVWHYIEATDRHNLLPYPDTVAHRNLLRRHDRQQDQERAVYIWILEHIPPTLSIAVKSLVDATPSEYYDCLVQKMNITPGKLRAEMQRKYDNAMMAISTRQTKYDNRIHKWALTMTAWRSKESNGNGIVSNAGNVGGSKNNGPVEQLSPDFL